MKRRITISLLALSIAAAWPFAAAQAADGGQITAISGQGLLHHDGAPTWSSAWPGEALMPGDALLAQPGSHLRLNVGDADITLRPNAEMDWAGQNGPLPVLRLDQGVADIVLPPDAWNYGLMILTPWGNARLQQPGAYRLSQLESGELRLVVWQGRADVPAFGISVWPGQQAMMSNRGASVVSAPINDEDYSRNGYGYAPPAVYAPAPVIVPGYGGIIVDEHRRMNEDHDRRRPDEQPRPNPNPNPRPVPVPAPQPQPQPPQQPHPQPPQQQQPQQFDHGHFGPKTGPTPPPSPTPAPAQHQQQPQPQQKPEDHGHDHRPNPNDPNGH
ncbi:MAG TPA: hypothetical protein VM661_00585 [Candidatus Sulfotelmatobacter sp.]|jgi:hypothetical protein|nr:hypothetical protein [Candidatus Sulfotelmatobacter sp.]